MSGDHSPDRSMADKMTADWAMGSAIHQSRQGFPAPNPHVGCCLVKEGQVIATGFHDHAGGPHAEIAALQKAGENAIGSDAYVTLEPCNGTGRTPPCSRALIAAKVRRVFYAVPDPNPKMAGGAEALQAAGVQCQHLAEYQAEAEAANAVWLKAMGSQRPFVALKAAMSLDGRIALPSGESRWITGEPARAQAHKLRAEYGAVLVGRRTAQVDNPLLTARIADVVNQPTRVVIDLENKLDPSLRVFDGSAPTLHVVREPRTDRQIAAPFNASELDLVALMTVLFEKGITALLVEGGAVTLASFLQAGLGDRIHLFVAPKMLGAGPSWLSDFAVSTLAGAPQWEFRDVRHHGTDLELILEPPQAS